MKVSVIGLGKLGLPMAAAIASRGFEVVGVDNSQGIVEALSNGQIHIKERGLEKLVESAGERLAFTTDIERAVLDTNISFVIVPTPSLEGGSFSNEYVFEACTDIGKALAEKDDYHIVVITSTVMPGTMAQVGRILEQISGKNIPDDVGLCYSPEFIALGNVIDDFLYPDFVLIGESDFVAGDDLDNFYRLLLGAHHELHIARTSFENAELAKLALNCLVVTKIAFANFLAQLCEKLPGGNITHVTNAIGMDSRIGRKYLTGGPPYGGPCFPRDTRALAVVAESLGVAHDLPTVVDTMNRQGVLRLYDLVIEAASPESVIAVLGLAYKSGTHITEESAGSKLVELLEAAGRSVVMSDPCIPDTDDAQSCVDVAQIVVIMLPYRGFAELEYKAGQTIIDCWRIMRPPMLMKNTGIKYIGLGLGEDP